MKHITSSASSSGLFFNLSLSIPAKQLFVFWVAFYTASGGHWPNPKGGGGGGAEPVGVILFHAPKAAQ